MHNETISILTTEALSALVASIVGLAIGGSVLLREPRRGTHVLFATFAFNIALLKLFTFLRAYTHAEFFQWASMLTAVSLPATAQRFFQAFLGDEAGPPPLSRSTVVGALIFYIALSISHFFVPLHTRTWFGVAFVVYVFAGLYSSVYYLHRRYRATPSRVEKIRLLYLVVGGVAAVTFALLDLIFSSWGGSFANVFITIYLFFLSQTLVRYRLLDLNELLGRMMVLATLVLIVTVVYGALVKWVPEDQHELFFFNTLVASAAILIVFDPLRTKVEGALTRWLFQEKYELSRRVANLRADLMNVIDVRDLVPRVLSALEDSRRVTHASIYIVDPDGSGYELAGHIGPRPEGRIDAVAHRTFVERLRRVGVISIEGLEREMGALRLTQSEDRENLSIMIHALELINGSVVLAISVEEQLLGMLVLRDERLREAREAYSSDEIELFRGVAASIGVTLQNSQLYELMRDRERLAALGQMAAGLAHEIRNPLGSIKGAAQVLQPIGEESKDSSIKEFLNIIVEEVDRLNKIVSQFLDYARPYRGDPRPLDINDVVKKTLQLLENEENAQRVEISTALIEGLPQVRADPEQLRQVFLNLSINALQAMVEGGKLHVSSSLRRSTRRGVAAAFLEVRFRDTGAGIPTGDLKSLFIPFFTTKEKGTGLGLPISQRIIENHGGTIEVRSRQGAGSTFTVLLPVEADAFASYAENKKRPPPLPVERTMTPAPALEGGESEPIRIVPPPARPLP